MKSREELDNFWKEVHENNELLAKFLGYQFKNGEYYALMSNSSGEYYDFLTEGEIWWDEHGQPVEELLFDESYEELDKVLEKIGKMKFDVHIYTHYNWKEPHRTIITDWKNNEIVSVSNDDKKRGMWIACVEFVKYINNIKNVTK